MTWTNFAIAPRRRLIATALMYGLTLTVRLTSAAGEEGSVHVQAAQCAAYASTFTFHNERPATPASRMADLQRSSWSRSCRAECEPAEPT
jgi:hypothetical protein